MSCEDDCKCYDTADIDYALCCCCGNDPSPQGQCTPKAVCNFAWVGGCCCAQIDFLDPLSCLFCVEKEEIPGWCSGGIGPYEGYGTCGPAQGGSGGAGGDGAGGAGGGTGGKGETRTT